MASIRGHYWLRTGRIAIVASRLPLTVPAQVPEAMGIAELRMAMARRAAMASELGDGVRPARWSRAAQVSQPKLWLRIDGCVHLLAEPQQDR